MSQITIPAGHVQMGCSSKCSLCDDEDVSGRDNYSVNCINWNMTKAYSGWPRAILAYETDWQHTQDYWSEKDTLTTVNLDDKLFIYK
jgi:hypothetical protein